MPIRKNGIIAALLIGFSLFSILPPVDAFTISRANQVGRLTAALTENKMLENDQIKPNGLLPEGDKKIISDAINYLAMMEYTKGLPYLDKDFDVYDDFYDVFGFYRYEENPYRQDSLYLSLNQQSAIDISDYEIFLVVNFYSQDQNQDPIISTFESEGKVYTLKWDKTLSPGRLILSDETDSELIGIDMKAVFDRFDTTQGDNYQVSKNFLSADQATFTQANDEAVISLIAMFLGIDKSGTQPYYSGDFYVLVQIR